MSAFQKKEETPNFYNC